MRKDKGIIILDNQLGIVKLDHFIAQVEEGQRIQVTYETLTDNATLGQLAKVHKCIRTIAHDTGDTFESVKKNIKKRSGLCVSFTHDKEQYDYYKSFGDCDKIELSSAIQAAIELGESLGINLF